MFIVSNRNGWIVEIFQSRSFMYCLLKMQYNSAIIKVNVTGK